MGKALGETVRSARIIAKVGSEVGLRQAAKVAATARAISARCFILANRTSVGFYYQVLPGAHARAGESGHFDFEGLADLGRRLRRIRIGGRRSGTIAGSLRRPSGTRGVFFCLPRTSSFVAARAGL